MVKSLKNSFAVFAVALAVLFVGVQFASAALTQTQKEALMALGFTSSQIAALEGLSMGGGSSCSGSYVHTMTLKVGSKGSQVAAMQSVVGATADGNFGPMTKSKVMAFQSSKGLVADGVVGPATGAALANASANCGNNGGSDNGSSGSADLNGDFGSINDVNELSQYNNEEVGEGQDDITVLGFEVEADNDGDIMIQSVKVSFDSTGNTGSDNLDDYVSEVTVWFKGKQVGSADVDEFSENGNVFSKTIALNNTAVVRADDTEKFMVAVSASNTFDSSDISGDSWTVDVDSLRFVDGSGVVTTETGYDLDGMDVAINFVSYSAAADTELKISTDSDSPEADVVIVDDSSSTDDVVLLKGKLRLEGTSDVVIDEFPVTFSPVGANINVIAESLKLVIDGEEYTESVASISDGTSGTVTFDNLDFDMNAGDTIEFEVLADITDLDGSTFAEGDSLEANVTSDNRDLMDVENEEGDQLSDSSEKSGTANGEAQEFRTEGVMVSLVSTSTSVTAGNSSNDDLGKFIIKYKVKAIGDSVYVSSAAAASLTTAGDGTVAGVERSGTATVGGVSVTVVNTTDDDQTANGNYLIEEGEEETFEMTVTVQLPTAGSAGQYRALLRAVDWSTSDDAVISGTGYTSNLDSFKTSYEALN